MGASNSSRSHPDGGLASDRQLFDFGRFLEGGALDDIFGIAPNTTPMPTPTPEDGKWEVTKLSGGMINVTVRVTPHRRDGELGRNRRSVVIKYAPPFIAAIGEDAPFGTFRQVSISLRSYRDFSPPRRPCQHTREFALLPFVQPQNADISEVDARSLNTEPYLYSDPHPASHLQRQNTGLRSRGSSSSSRTIECWCSKT